MKIPVFQRVVQVLLSIRVMLFISLMLLCGASIAQGEGLFKAKCATCHAVFKNGTGPKLYEARKRWEDAGEGDLIYEWVRNNAALRASGKSVRALEVFQEYNGSVMSAFGDLTNDQISSILDWVDSQDPNASAGGGNVAQATSSDMSLSLIHI